MAFTTTPDTSNQKTERYQFIGNLEQMDGRDLSQQRLVNLMPELSYVPATQEKIYRVRKRPGLKPYASFAAGVARGIFNWRGKVFTVIGNSCYVDNVFLFTLSSFTTRVGFSAYFGQTYGQGLVIVDGNDGWIVKPDMSVNYINDPEFPRPHVPDPITVDEYLILSKSDSGDFYQSDLDNPMSWTPGNFNTAEMFPDNTVALTKFKNYIVVGGSNSVEFFYDSGNPSGSSFERNDAVVEQIGVLVPMTLKTTEEDIFFVGESSQGGKSVWMIEKFKPVDIATITIRQAIDAEGPSIANASAVVIRTVGHQFYVLSLTSRTFVYDTDIKMWHEWSYNNGLFDFRFASYNGVNNPLLLHSSNGTVYEMEQFTYTDNILPITCIAQTDDLDFKSYNRKSFLRLTLITDQYIPTDSFIDVYWTDDDFVTIAGPRRLQLNAPFPGFYKMGMSRNRAFRFVFTENNPLRLSGYELDVSILTR